MELCTNVFLASCDLVCNCLTFPVGTRVCVYDGENSGRCGKITETDYDGEPDLYLIQFDNSDDDVILTPDEFILL